MADQAFALSPISARAAQPREEDYEAISEAFMETSRGRWFLGEYARRNRNADTHMVLDAVGRIEESIAAQKRPAPDHGLAEALSAIKSAVDEARALASAALDGLALEESLAPVRKGARVIREISWRLREIGADGRICDLIDSQIVAIEAGCGQISTAGARSGLGAAFDLLEQRIEAFDDSDTTKPPETEDTVPSSSPAPSDETRAAKEAALSPDAASDREAANKVLSRPEEAAVAPPEVADVPAEIADAHDEAVLDMVAFEMAAPDSSDVDDVVWTDPVPADPAPIAAADVDPGDNRLAQPPRADPQTIAPAPEPAMAPTAQPAQPSLVQPSLQRHVEPPRELSMREPSVPESAIEPISEPSLGASLIANGIVRRRHELAPDPLAPIRRMSQAEKIALFS